MPTSDTSTIGARRPGAPATLLPRHRDPQACGGSSETATEHVGIRHFRCTASAADRPSGLLWEGV